jgi:hypothetical protein
MAGWHGLASSWSTARRVVAKVEFHAGELWTADQTRPVFLAFAGRRAPEPEAIRQHA